MKVQFMLNATVNPTAMESMMTKIINASAAQDGSRWLTMASRLIRAGFKMQDSFKMIPRWPEIAPKMAPKRCKTAEERNMSWTNITFMKPEQQF